MSSRLLFIAFTLALIYSINASAEERRLKHLPGVASSYRVEDVASIQLPTILEH